MRVYLIAIFFGTQVHGFELDKNLWFMNSLLVINKLVIFNVSMNDYFCHSPLARNLEQC